MNLRRHLTADAAAGALLVGAAAVLLSTPYDGGTCRNVAAAYAMPAASIEKAEPPKAPSALIEARQALTEAKAAVAEVEAEKKEVEQARAAAADARAAASDALADTWAMPSTGSSSTFMEESELDAAERAVEYAEDWLAQVKDGAASSDYPIWSQSDVDRAQDDLDDARADVAEAKAALAAAQTEAAAHEAEAADAQATADQLDAEADAAEKAATEAAEGHRLRESETQQRLQAASSGVSEIELDHEVALAEWSHDRRVAADEVKALNNVRESCRDNGVWRAGIALLDSVVVAALVLRRWTPRLPELRPLRRLRWRR